MQEIKIFVKIAVQYFKVYLEEFGVCIFCVLEKLQGRYFCNYAVLTAQLAKLGLEVLSARGFYYKLGIDTKTSALRVVLSNYFSLILNLWLTNYYLTLGLSVSVIRCTWQ